VYICAINQTLKHKAMTHTIATQVQNLIMDANFRKACAATAKANGITAQEWNENKVNILYMWATQVVCGK